MAWHWFVYIIECKDGSYYTGRSWDYEERYEMHRSGNGAFYTARHGVKRLAYIEEYDSFEAAVLRERQIHGWSKKKKEKLISGEWKKPNKQEPDDLD